MRDTRGPDRLVVARAPLRVSLGGGGTDLPSYADRFGGLVVSLAINRYVSVTVFPRSFTGEIRLTGEHTEQAGNVDGVRSRFARAALIRAGIHRNVQLASCTDAPSGTGLGGSGAFTVALLHALRHRRSPDPGTLAEEASAIEMVDLARPVGKHDHYLAAYGGLRALHIGADRSVRVEEMPLTAELTSYLRDRLLLFYTGLSRDAGQVLTLQAQQTVRGDRGTVTSLHAIRKVADWVRDAILAGRIDDIGPLLDEHWQHKERLSDRISTGRIGELYRTARSAGSDGGKLLGAGGGGFLLISTARGRTAEVRAAMADQRVIELPFDLDRTGSQMTGLPL